MTALPADGDLLTFALVLVGQGDGPDEPQVLGVVASVARGPVAETERRRVRVHHRDRTQQSLRIDVQCDDVCATGAGNETFDGLAIALGDLDGPGLVASLVDRQHQQPVGQLLVELGRRGGQKQGHRSGDLVGVGDQATA